MEVGRKGNLTAAEGRPEHRGSATRTGLHESHLLGESDLDSSQRIVSIRCESRESKGFGEKSRN